jgi:mitochondrial pyruvate carrier 2
MTTCVRQALVAAGISDINRPAERLSVLQSGGLWPPRYARCIAGGADPPNYSLMTVNGFVAATGLYQCYRIWRYVRARASESG